MNHRSAAAGRREDDHAGPLRNHSAPLGPLFRWSAVQLTQFGREPLLKPAGWSDSSLPGHGVVSPIPRVDFEEMRSYSF